MFSSFMTAFNMFSHDFFSNNLDRVKIGENTIIMSTYQDKCFCYVIKGQTYPAQQKLDSFLTKIKCSTNILTTLNKACLSGEEINYMNLPILQKIVKKIFL